jgi:hypothetical protein
VRQANISILGIPLTHMIENGLEVEDSEKPFLRRVFLMILISPPPNLK